MVTSMRAAVTKAEEQLAKAEAAGDTKRIEEAKANLATRREWLAEAEKSASRLPPLNAQRSARPAGAGAGRGTPTAACRAGRPASAGGAGLGGVARAGCAGARAARRRRPGRCGLAAVTTVSTTSPGRTPSRRREVHEPAVAGAAGEPAGRGVLAALARGDESSTVRPTSARFSAQLISSCSAVSRRYRSWTTSLGTCRPSRRPGCRGAWSTGR